MAGHPKVTVFGYVPYRDRVDCMVGDDHEAIPITIKASRRCHANGEVIEGPSLWVRSTTSPYYAFPWLFGGIVYALTETNTVVEFAKAGSASHFAVGDTVTRLVQGTGLEGASTTITAVDEDANKVTLSGAIGSLAVNDILYIETAVATYGSITKYEQSVNLCVVLEDIHLEEDADQIAAGYIKGTFIKDKVKGATYIVSGQAESTRVDTTVLSATAIPIQNNLQFINIIT